MRSTSLGGELVAPEFAQATIPVGEKWLPTGSPTQYNKWYPLPLLFSDHQPSRDVPGKERLKRGTGKKGERNVFFPFPFLHFWAHFFSRFWPKSQKTGEKRGGTAKKRLERCRTAKNGRSLPFQILEFGEIPFFTPFKTHFCPRSNPFFYPIPTPFLPLSFPVLVPFLYCLAIISRCVPVVNQPLDHVGPSLVRGTSGRFIFVVRRC